MCCNNRQREIWVILLVILGCLLSLAASSAMILVSYPGDECLLFVSVRGEALIYGHPAGCKFLSAAHIIVILAGIIFLVSVVVCGRRNRVPVPTGSNKTLRGSVATMNTDSLRAKPSVSLIVFSVLIAVFVIISATVIVSGYIVTCGELQYEAQRKIYDGLTLGPPINNVGFTCFSLFRKQDFHTRFHFDHYELAGSWHGQYTAYRHGRPHVWTGTHEHGIEIATGIELSIASCILSAMLWVAITVLLITHRKSVKASNRLRVAESIEDAKIWAADMNSMNAQQDTRGLHQYEMLARQQGQNMQLQHNQYESLGGSLVSGSTVRQVGSMQQSGPVPSTQTQSPPHSDISDVDTLLAHQSVIASHHPDGSFFLTPSGTYVQLVNGVLTNVEITPVPQELPVQYSELTFQDQFGPPSNPVSSHSLPPQPLPSNTSHSSHPSSLPNAPLQPQKYTQPKPQFNSQFQSQFQSQCQPYPQPESTTSQSISLISQTSSQDPVSISGTENTRMDMRRQKDMATMAGMKCSQL